MYIYVCCVCSVNNNSIFEPSDKCKFVIFFSFAHNLTPICVCVFYSTMLTLHIFFSFCTRNTQLLIIFYSIVFPFFFASLCAIPAKFLWVERASQNIPLFYFNKSDTNMQTYGRRLEYIWAEWIPGCKTLLGFNAEKSEICGAHTHTQIRL